LLADRKFDAFGNARSIDLLYGVVMTGSVSVFRGDFDRRLIADSHADDRGFELWDNVALTNRELQRVAPFGRVEQGPVLEFAAIVDMHGIAVRGLRHGMSPFFPTAKRLGRSGDIPKQWSADRG